MLHVIFAHCLQEKSLLFFPQEFVKNLKNFELGVHFALLPTFKHFWPMGQKYNMYIYITCKFSDKIKLN